MITSYNIFESFIDPNRIDKLKWKDENGKWIIIEIPHTELAREVNSNVYKYISKTYRYKPYSGNNQIKINNNVFYSEYIDKFINNMRIYENACRNNNIRDKETFKSYINSNLYDLYHYNGNFFEENYNTVINTTAKGRRGEVFSLTYFQNLLNNKYPGQKIEIEIKNADEKTPDEIKKDVGGLDGSFMWDGKEISIQVKPFDRYDENIDDIIIKSSGSMEIHNVIYLILYREKYKDKKYLYDIIILKNDKNQIKVQGDTYTTNKENIISRKFLIDAQLQIKF